MHCPRHSRWTFTEACNPRFAKSALARDTPNDFLNLLCRQHIAYHEKHRGQLLCDRSVEDIITLLLAECMAGGVQRWQPCSLQAVRYSDAAPVLHAGHHPGHGIQPGAGHCQTV